MDSCFSHSYEVKHKQLHPGFELRLPIPFPTTTAITQSEPPTLKYTLL